MTLLWSIIHSLLSVTFGIGTLFMLNNTQSQLGKYTMVSWLKRSMLPLGFDERPTICNSLAKQTVT